MKFIYEITGKILTSEITDKVAGIGGGMTASILTFVNAGFGGFMLKCVAAAIFALIGGLMGYAGKKLGEHIYRKLKQRKEQKQ